PPLGICRPQGLLLKAADLLRDSRECCVVAVCFYVELHRTCRCLVKVIPLSMVLCHCTALPHAAYSDGHG
ncbi:hypothetical protein K443DRAFT_91680, partial [Laccaria amethystina LaAM-08-1]